MFAIDERDQPTLPFQLLDEMYSDSRHDDHCDSQESDLLSLPIDDEEDVLVDRILSERVVRFCDR